MKSLWIGLSVVVVLAGSVKVEAQDFFSDLFREARDEVRLEQDYQQLNRDAANGNVVGEIFDVMRIQQDRANLIQDQRQLNYDLNGGYGYSNGVGNALVPSTTNPGYYYYPNNPGQLYYYPNQQPAQQQVTAPVNGVPRGVASTVATGPQVLQAVKIANPEALGVDLSFVFGGKTFSVESGQTKEFMITAPTLIVFSKGGQAGEARYTLTGGNTFEFQYGDAGWSLVQKRREQAVAKVTESGLPQNPVPRQPTAPAPAPVEATTVQVSPK